MVGRFNEKGRVMTDFPDRMCAAACAGGNRPGGLRCEAESGMIKNREQMTAFLPGFYYNLGGSV